MILVGLTSVAEHPTLSPTRQASTLTQLAAYLPIVEIDTSFYHIPKAAVVAHWQQQVPEQFGFIVKAHQTMTGHRQDDVAALTAQFTALRQALTPLFATRQLKAVLFQFPPYYGVTPSAVRYLRWVRKQYPDVPVAIEFRHPAWYAPAHQEATLALLRKLAFIHVVVDAPQTPSGSVPLVATATNPELTIMRLHGRNYAGWQTRQSAWRSARTNYRYTTAELAALLAVGRRLATESAHVAVIFNNNGGGDAAMNALAFIAQAGIAYQHLAPHQLDLF